MTRVEVHSHQNWRGSPPTDSAAAARRRSGSREVRAAGIGAPGRQVPRCTVLGEPDGGAAGGGAARSGPGVTGRIRVL
ncbi:hypothetical protein GCM10009665_12480 [Kitasatospora nipponensis]|uniref:Uncharacterized protein n=1 Tax=Kitasatospora nipponensis TaxID=258049 RepID=A0ABN1VVM2_9ACTN